MKLSPLDSHPSGKWAVVSSLWTTSGDKTGSWQAGLEEEFFQQLRNEGRRRGEMLPILPESADTMAVTLFASKRDRKQSHRDI